MLRFTRLFRELDESNRTRDKVAALAQYFAEAAPADAAWALWFLWGNRLDARIPAKRLRQWAADLSGHPDWLVDACYERVGDLAETAALLLPAAPEARSQPPLHAVVRDHLLPLRHWDERFQFQLLREFWCSLDREQALLVNKMLTGGFRVGVSRQLLVRGLAEALGVDRSTLTHRLMGEWEATAAFFQSLRDGEANAAALAARPYPFYLASPLDGPPSALGDPRDWLAEWKWDGIRAQLIRRDGGAHLWSRGDERLTPAFPELVAAAAALPDGTVLDGEILCWEADRPLPFHVLQTRISRKERDAAVIASAPAAFIAYDCLESGGADRRGEPLQRRRERLQALLQAAGAGALRLSPELPLAGWEALDEARAQSRERGVEGLMLKRRDGAYRVGRVRGEWWKWKVDPHSADLVLVYAQAGHGRRATLYTDYTLAARDGDQLVPVAKAYSGLTDAEIREVDRWIQRHTLARRGPVRTVPPELVFEIGFEGLRPSSRHKSGLAMRFPRILRWRRDKPAAEVDTVADLRKLLD
jgi:DNA ligase 1